MFASGELENHTRKGKVKDGNWRRKKEGKEKKKKALAAFLVFKSSSLKIAFEREKTACKVMLTHAARQKSDKQNNTFNM